MKGDDKMYSQDLITDMDKTGFWPVEDDERSFDMVCVNHKAMVRVSFLEDDGIIIRVMKGDARTILWSVEVHGNETPWLAVETILALAMFHGSMLDYDAGTSAHLD